MLTRLILTVLCATAAVAQTLDTVVRFPYEVEELFHVPGGNKLYVTAFVRDSGTDHVYILDCATMAIRREIPTGTSSTEGYHRAAWCQEHNKVYVGLGWHPPGALAVIDNATDSVLRRLPVSVHYRGIAHSSTSDKLYVVGTDSISTPITVLDCAADTVLEVIRPTDYSAGYIAVWDSVGDKMYLGGRGWNNADRVTAVDCRSDSVVAVIRTGIGWPAVAACSPSRRKLYFGSTDDFGVPVIDCATDSVITRFDSIWSQDDYLPVYCSAEDKVYWPVPSSTANRPDTVIVIDCLTDSIVRRFPVAGVSHVRVCGYAPWSNRLYVASSVGIAESYLTVYDCRDDSLIGQTRFGKSAAEVVCNPVDHRIYVSDFWDSAVYVFREDLQPVAEEPERGSYQRQEVRVWPNPARDWLYVDGTEPLAIYSAGGRRLLALTPGRNRLPRNLVAGVYFMRMAQAQAQAVRKVVITR